MKGGKRGKRGKGGKGGKRREEKGRRETAKEGGREGGRERGRERAAIETAYRGRPGHESARHSLALKCGNDSQAARPKMRETSPPRHFKFSFCLGFYSSFASSSPRHSTHFGATVQFISDSFGYVSNQQIVSMLLT